MGPSRHADSGPVSLIRMSTALRNSLVRAGRVGGG